MALTKRIEQPVAIQPAEVAAVSSSQPANGGSQPANGGSQPARGAKWLEAFHRGEPAALEQCYREHFSTVERAIGAILSGADRETVIHEVFTRLIAGEALRRAFGGGALGAWLGTLARNQAIDYRRRMGREVALSAEGADRGGPEPQDAVDAHLLIERFRRDHLPQGWGGVFELRFLKQLSQREAASALGIRRTTLAYRELQIRRSLKRFLLEGDE